MSTASGPMAKWAAKARTPKSAPGSDALPACARRAAGFTLIELLIVVALIAVASGVATLALRDPAATHLEQEAPPLTALLEAARSESRASGISVTWEPRTGTEPDAPRGFRFVGLAASSELPSHWLDDNVSAEILGSRTVLLGPEPMI